MSLLEIADAYEKRAIENADKYKGASFERGQYAGEWSAIANMLIISRELRFISRRQHIEGLSACDT